MTNILFINDEAEKGRKEFHARELLRPELYLAGNQSYSALVPSFNVFLVSVWKKRYNIRICLRYNHVIYVEQLGKASKRQFTTMSFLLVFILGQDVRLLLKYLSLNVCSSSLMVNWLQGTILPLLSFAKRLTELYRPTTDIAAQAADRISWLMYGD